MVRILFFKSKPIFRSNLMCKKANRKSLKLPPLSEVTENLQSASSHLKLLIFNLITDLELFLLFHYCMHLMSWVLSETTKR